MDYITEVVGKGGISAAIVEDSKHYQLIGRRLTTFRLVYPRFIHSELMTHRVFSRNASSSRAIPVSKMLEQVRNNPAMPIHWGKNQPGMQAREECTELIDISVDGGVWTGDAPDTWKLAAAAAADIAEAMSKAGYHKQVANRLLEPFQFMNVIVTATELDNWFELRDHEDAEPTIQELAQCMRRARGNSKPKTLLNGEWHLPFVTEEERRVLTIQQMRAASAARCARVSYLTHEGKEPDLVKDMELFEKLVGSHPMHASPIEHQATPDHYYEGRWNNRDQWGNLKTWIQFRKVWEQQGTK